MALVLGKIRKMFEDSLFRNSFYLMANTGIQSGFGFFFWLICARMYSASDVGLATSLISAATLVSVFSMLGFNNVIVRFLPSSKDKDRQLSTALTLTSVASFFSGGIFLLWAYLTHSPTAQSGHPAMLTVLFVFFVLCITVNSIIESAFIANRASKYVLLKNILLSALKVGLVAALGSLYAGTGSIGIVSAIAIATFISFLCGCAIFISKFKYKATFCIDREVIAETKRFAIGNYLGTLFGVLPSTTLILIVVSRLGAQEAAFLYMPSMILSLLNVIPSSTAQSLFAEVSHDEANFILYFKKSLKHLFSFLVPAVGAVWIFGGFVLKFFGHDYSSAGTLPLQIMSLASLIGAVNYLGDTLLNIKKHSGMYIFMNALNSFAVVVPAYIFAPYGLAAVGWSVLFGQVATACIYVVMNWKLLAEIKRDFSAPHGSGGLSKAI